MFRTSTLHLTENQEKKPINLLFYFVLRLLRCSLNYCGKNKITFLRGGNKKSHIYLPVFFVMSRKETEENVGKEISMTYVRRYFIKKKTRVEFLMHARDRQARYIAVENNSDPRPRKSVTANVANRHDPVTKAIQISRLLHFRCKSTRRRPRERLDAPPGTIVQHNR